MLATLISHLLVSWVLVPWIVSVVLFANALRTIRSSMYISHAFAYFMVLSVDSLTSAFRYESYYLILPAVISVYTGITVHFIMSYHHYDSELTYTACAVLFILCAAGYIINSPLYIYAFSFIFSIILCVIAGREMLRTYATVSESMKILVFSLLYSMLLVFSVLFFSLYNIRVVWSPYVICGIFALHTHIVKEYRPIKIKTEKCSASEKTKNAVNFMKNMNEVRRKVEHARRRNVCSLIIGKYGNPFLKKYERMRNFSILYVGISEYVTCVHPSNISTVGAVIFDFCRLNEYSQVFIMDADYLVSNNSIFDFIELVKKIKKYARCELNIYSEYLTEDEWNLLRRIS